MPFNFSSPEFLSHGKLRKNQVSPVSRASPAHMNSPLTSFARSVWESIALSFYNRQYFPLQTEQTKLIGHYYTLETDTWDRCAYPRDTSLLADACNIYFYMRLRAG